MFRVGQKVVCVDAETLFPHRLGTGSFQIDEALVNGAIYTVRRDFIDHEGDRILWLEEVKRNERAKTFWGPDAGYGAWRFRPLVERKTSIEIFERMLTPDLERVR
jgi:hypothetical protein